MKPVAGICDTCGSDWHPMHTLTECLAMQGRKARLAVLIQSAANLAARIGDLTLQREDVLDQIRSYGLGDYQTDAGTVRVRPPNRTFDVTRAINFIPSDQRSQYVTVKLDEKLIKKALTAEQLAESMVPGTGRPRVIFE